MPATYYPAVIDRSASGFGVSFPDFPGCIASGDTPAEAALKGELALGFHIDAMVKDGDPIPDPTGLEGIEPLDAARDVALVLIRADVAPKVQRVLISMDERLLRQIDAVASNRSAFLASAAWEKLASDVLQRNKRGEVTISSNEAELG